MNFNIFDKNDPKDFSDEEEIFCVIIFFVFILIGFATPMGFIVAGIISLRQIARFQARKKISKVKKKD